MQETVGEREVEGADEGEEGVELCGNIFYAWFQEDANKNY